VLLIESFSTWPGGGKNWVPDKGVLGSALRFEIFALPMAWPSHYPPAFLIDLPPTVQQHHAENTEIKIYEVSSVSMASSERVSIDGRIFCPT